MKCYSYIRFSSPEQAKGRSYERQLESARRFAKEQGWKLDETLCMFDPGLSAFSQEHLSKGALGTFLQAVEAGRIPIPSALLVENLDRLSRDKIPLALKQFLNLIEAGITIVTLMDRQVYNFESISRGMEQLLISISIMARAHEESKTKSIRRADAWRKGRKDARTVKKKINARCVAWLRLSEDKTKFVLIQNRVETVRRIYDLHIKGHGLGGICKILNADNVPTFQKSTKGWGTTSVRRILSTKTVLGEMQFKKMVVSDGKKRMVDDGDPILDYYPQIISQDIFYKAQEQTRLRKKSYGRIGKRNNLFQGIVRCGYCGSTMQYGTRGRKKHKYLNCADSVRGLCTYASFRYQDLEDVFLLHCDKLRLQNIIKSGSSEQGKRVESLRSRLLTIKSNIKESKQRVKNFTEALGVASSPDTIEHLVRLIDEEKIVQRELFKRMEGVEQRIANVENTHRNAERKLTDLKKVVRQISTAKDSDREDIRRRLQREIRALVKRIDIYPHGVGFVRLQNLINESGNEELRSDFKKYVRTQAKKHRSVTIHFRGGGILQIKNDRKTGKLAFYAESDEKGMTRRSLESLVSKLRYHSTDREIRQLLGEM